jgi:hypothetical protein
MTITLFTIIGVFATIIAFLVSGLILAAYVKGWREGCGFDLSDAVVFGVSALVFVCSMLALVVH